MKKLLLSFILLIALSVVTNAQRIYFCANYTEAGEPISPGSLWNIEPSGGFVYVLFQSGGPVINSNLNFHISKLSGNDYVAFDVKSVTPTAGSNWALLDYKFMSEGDYRFIVKDVDNNELAKEYVSIKLKSSTTSSTTTTDNTNSSSTMYYTYSSVKAGTAVDNITGYITNEGSNFKLNKDGSTLCFKVSNAPKTLGTTKLIVDVYKMSSAGKYEFFETLNYNIADLDWTYFKYTIANPGSYKLKVYNGQSVWINDCLITVTKK
ncbi:MAG TPA: hypothetical protein VIK89_01715 [Cytophagaceae bacterium]